MTRREQMSRLDTEDKLTAEAIAGYATELTVWRFINQIAAAIGASHTQGKACGLKRLEDVVIEGKNFKLQIVATCNQTPAEDIWNLGACVYRLLMGEDPFGGRGRDGQTMLSPLPHLSEAEYSAELSEMMTSCLEYDSEKRPSATEILNTSQEMVEKCAAFARDLNNLAMYNPKNRQRRMNYYSFWPEAMAMLIIVALLALPLCVSAQKLPQAGSNTSKNEMLTHNNSEIKNLINAVTKLRDKKKREAVRKYLASDSLWTRMNELEYDDNECTIEDDVEMFGINHVASQVEMSRRGKLNAGNRFTNSADGIHKYSFNEFTVKAGKEVTYSVKSHKGKQFVAIVPFNKNQKYATVIWTKKQKVTPYKYNSGGTTDGISYLTIDLAGANEYWFSIKNNGTDNASFVVITYNSGRQL